MFLLLQCIIGNIALQYGEDEPKMKGQLTVRLTDELEDGLEALSRKLDRKRSDVVRIALERFLREEGESQSDRPYERVKDLLGSVESGVPDLGGNHREHLKSRFRRDA